MFCGLEITNESMLEMGTDIIYTHIVMKVLSTALKSGAIQITLKFRVALTILWFGFSPNALKDHYDLQCILFFS